MQREGRMGHLLDNLRLNRSRARVARGLEGLSEPRAAVQAAALKANAQPRH